MQGWGQLVNQGLLVIFMLIFHGTGDPPYYDVSTQPTFRLSFAFIGFVNLWLVYYRIYKVKDADAVLKVAKKKGSVTGYDTRSLKLVFSHFGMRLVGTAGCWFIGDVFFYGNKIFQGVFIKIIAPGSSVFEGWLWNLVNITVSLVGYYMAAILVDHKLWGRKRMQFTGFFMAFLIFLICAPLFNTLQEAGTNVKCFQFLYFFSSFWIQFGPNATTFLLAAELYPTSVRATAHGLSAASGKCGALLAAALYNYIGNQTKFWFVCWWGLAAAIMTFVLIPDTTGMDLRELDRYWLCVRDGRAADYHGIAVHPRHLSFWERVVLKRHLAYDPVLDKQQKVEELRTLYEASISDKESLDAVDHALMSRCATYFDNEKAARVGDNSPTGSNRKQEV